MTTRLKNLLQPQGPLWPVALARIMIGILWLFSLRWKLPPAFAAPPGLRGLQDWMQLQVQHPAFDFYAGFVQTVVLPNFTLFAWLIFLAELLVGLSLLLGFQVRWGALLGLLLSLNLLVGLLDVPGEWPWSYVMLAMWHGVFMVTGAGLVLGLDGWRRRRAVPAP